MRVFQKLMAKRLCTVYVCDKVGNYTALRNTDGGIVDHTRSFMLNTCDTSEHIYNVAVQMLVYTTEQNFVIHFWGGQKFCT